MEVKAGKTPSQRDAEHLERLRFSPDERTWRIEIEHILDGVRDVSIRHLGDAAEYVEVLIEQSENSAESRVVFQDALEEQVMRWQPGIRLGDAMMLDLLRHFTPLAGLIRLLEMFDLPRAFAGDPPPEEPKFRGRDLRLQAFHALERYFPSIPRRSRYVRKDDAMEIIFPDLQGFATYIFLLLDNRIYPRYQDYVDRTLEKLEVPEWWSNVPKKEAEHELEVHFQQTPLFCPTAAGPATQRAFMIALARGATFVEDFVQGLGYSYVYLEEKILIANEGKEIVLTVPKRYFAIYQELVDRNYSLDMEFVAEEADAALASYI